VKFSGFLSSAMCWKIRTPKFLILKDPPFTFFFMGGKGEKSLCLTEIPLRLGVITWYTSSELRSRSKSTWMNSQSQQSGTTIQLRAQGKLCWREFQLIWSHLSATPCVAGFDVWMNTDCYGIYEGWNFNSGNYLFTTDTK